MSVCADITIGNPAVALTEEGWTTFRGWSMQAFNLAINNVDSLTSFNIDAPSTGVSFNSTPVSIGFSPPAAPSAPDVTMAPFEDPPALEQIEVEPPELEAFPVFNGQAPSLAFPSVPPGFSATDPGNAPTLEYMDMPEDLTLPTIPSPDLLELDMPTMGELDFPDWDVERPVIDFQVPDENWSFTPDTYASALLTSVQSRISTMLQGGTGLPAAVEAALRQRAFAAVEREELTAVDQTFAEFAARGFDEPNGILASRVAQTRQNATNQRANLSRDIYIRAHEVEIENIRFAVTSGIQVEGVTIGLFMEQQRLLLEAAKFRRDSDIAIFNARVGLFNATVERYRAEAQVYRERIQAEIARVIESFKAQVDAQRLKTEINRDLVAIFEQRIRAEVLAPVEVYNARINAARAWADVQNSIMEGYRARVLAYAERVRAFAERWRGFVAQVEAEAARGRVFESQVQAHATLVNAVAQQNQSAIAARELDNRTNEQKVRAYLANLDLRRTQIDAEARRIGALGDIYQGQAAIYAAGGNIARSASDVATANAQINVERERSRVAALQESVRLAVTESLQRAGLQLEAIKGAASAAAQLAAAAFSAVNFGASVSSSQGITKGQSCGTSYTYSGEIGT